jgi:hypothetical protein
MRTVSYLILCGAALSGCGGSSTGTIGYDQVELNALNLYSSLSNLPITGTGDIPTSGTANYAGYIAVVAPGYASIGDLNLNVGFASGSIAGSAGNFIDNSEERISGTLKVTNGAINRNADPFSDYQFSAELNGVLSDSAGNAAVSGDMYGDFLGQDANAMAGIVEGVVISPTLGSVALSSDNSVFGAKRTN